VCATIASTSGHKCKIPYLKKILFTPPEVANTGPVFNRGPGAAPGGVASKNGWVYMRVQGGFDLHSLICPYSVRLRVV